MRQADIVGTREAGMSFDALHLVATDRRSGSAAVASRAAQALAEIALSLSREAISDAVRILVQGQPVMAACLRLADVVLRGLEADGSPGALRAAKAFGTKLGSEKAALNANLRKKLPREGAILTVSASSTVIDALITGPQLMVLCAVSDPGGEGKTAAETLRAYGFEASVIPDGAVAQQSTRVDAIVIGADVLGPTSILNKTGTLAAALGARSNARPCLVVAGTSKLVDETTWARLAATAERLAVEGIRAFEEVRNELVTSFITEEGVTSARQLRRAARSVRLHPQIGIWLES